MKWTSKLLFAVAVLAALSLVAMVSRQRMQTPAEVLDQVREVLRSKSYNDQVVLRRLDAAIRRAENHAEVPVDVCAELRLTRGKLLLEIGAVNDAREDFELVLDLYLPGDSDVRRLLIQANSRAGDLTGALARLVKLLKDEPEYGPAWVDRGRIHQLLARQALDECHDRLRYVLAADDAEVAGQFLERLAAQDPSDPARTGVILGLREVFPGQEEEVLAQLLASCEVASEELREARKAFVRSFPFVVDPVAASGYLEILLAASRSSEAIQLGIVASRIAPESNNAEIGQLLIQALTERGDLAHAADIADDWLQAGVPLSAEFLKLICKAAYQGKRTATLRLAAHRLRQIGTPADQQLVALYRGFALSSGTKYLEAVNNLGAFARSRAAEPFPEARILAWHKIAELHREHGDTNREREALQAIVLADPDYSGEVWLRRAEVQTESRHSGYQLPLDSWAKGMSLLPHRTDELMPNFVQLGERSLAAQDQDLDVLYQTLVRENRAIPLRDYGPYALHRLAQLHGENGNPRAQATVARRLLLKLPGFVPALDQLLEARLAQGNRAEYVELVVQRIELTGLTDVSSDLLNTIQKEEVDREQLVRLMIADVEETGKLTVAFYLHERGQSDDALQTLENTAPEERTRQESLLAARILIENGKYRRALSWLEEVPDGGATAIRRDRMALRCALKLSDIKRLREITAKIMSRPELPEDELLDLADLYFRLGKPQGAVQILEALEARPESSRGPVLLRFALIALHQGEIEVAAEILERAEAFAPEVEAAVLRLLIHSRRGNWIACAETASRLRDDVPIERPLVATMLALLEGQQAEALEIAEFGVEITPGVLGWHLAVSAAHLLQGENPVLDSNFGKAGLEETRLFLTGSSASPGIDPRETVALLLASELPDFSAYVQAELGGMAADVRGELWPRLCQAYLLAEAGEYGEARPILEKLIFFADCLPVWDLLEEVLSAQLGSADHPNVVSLRELRSTLLANLDPEGADALLTRARGSLLRNQLETCLRQARRLLRENPGSEDGLLLLAQVQTEMRSWEAALGSWRALLLRAPNYAPGPGLPGLIDLLLQSQAFSPPGLARSAAIEELEKQALRFPDDPRLPLALARLDLGMDLANPQIGVERAWLRLLEFRDSHPNTSLEELRRGAAGEWARFHVELDPDAALEFLEAERLLQPGDIELWRLLGRVQRQLGDLQGSLDTLTHASKMSRDPRILVELARSQAASGEALKVVSRSLQLARKLQGGPRSMEHPLLEAECLMNQLTPPSWEAAVSRLEPIWEARQTLKTKAELARVAELYARALLMRHAEGDANHALDVLREALPAAARLYQREYFRALGGIGRSTMAVTE